MKINLNKSLFFILLFLFVFPLIGSAAEECKTFLGAAPYGDYCPDCYFEDKTTSGPAVCSDKWRYLVYTDETSVNQRCKELGYEYGTVLETYPYSEWCYYCNAGMKKYITKDSKWKFLTSCEKNKTVKKAKCCRQIPEFSVSVSKGGSGIGGITSDPSGITCGNDCSYSYESGTVITLTAITSPVSVFSGWSGACSGSSTTCQITMNENKTVTATFDPMPFPTVNLQSSANTVPFGDSFTLSWTTENAYSCNAFGDWSGSRATSGLSEIQLSATGLHTFTLTCLNFVQDSTSDTVNVQSVAKPPVVFTKPAVITH
ncbi:MAG: hypothetical protein WCZ99_01150 [Candidatus Paceibacterota bacterium]